jgi:hypothetical protein
MRWVKKQEAFFAEHFSLLNEDSPVLELRFNAHTNTARVECDGEKRAFMIEYGGLFRNSILFKNEYGYEIGHLHVENNNGAEGYVQIENERFSYAVNNTSLPKLDFYNTDSVAPVGSCLLPDKSVAGFSKTIDFRKQPLNAALILLVGWYLCLPLLKVKGNLV